MACDHPCELLHAGGCACAGLLAPAVTTHMLCPGFLHVTPACTYPGSVCQHVCLCVGLRVPWETLGMCVWAGLMLHTLDDHVSVRPWGLRSVCVTCLQLCASSQYVWHVYVCERLRIQMHVSMSQNVYKSEPWVCVSPSPNTGPHVALGLCLSTRLSACGGAGVTCFHGPCVWRPHVCSLSLCLWLLVRGCGLP